MDFLRNSMGYERKGVGSVAHCIPDIAHTFPGIAHEKTDVAHTFPLVAHCLPDVAHAFPNVVHAFLFIAHTFPDIAHALPDVVHGFSAALNGNMLTKKEDTVFSIPLVDFFVVIFLSVSIACGLYVGVREKRISDKGRGKDWDLQVFWTKGGKKGD